MNEDIGCIHGVTLIDPWSDFDWKDLQISKFRPFSHLLTIYAVKTYSVTIWLQKTYYMPKIVNFLALLLCFKGALLLYKYVN